MISVYTAFKYRNSLVVFSPVYDDMIDFKPLEPRTSHKQEFDLAQAMMLRQRSRYLRFARPPQEKQLMDSRAQLVRRSRALLILRFELWTVLNTTYDTQNIRLLTT